MLSIVLFVFKTKFRELGTCLRPQVKTLLKMGLIHVTSLPISRLQNQQNNIYNQYTIENIYGNLELVGNYNT
jgi:hypothetical protein